MKSHKNANSLRPNNLTPTALPQQRSQKEKTVCKSHPLWCYLELSDPPGQQQHISNNSYHLLKDFRGRSWHAPKPHCHGCGHWSSEHKAVTKTRSRGRYMAEPRLEPQVWGLFHSPARVAWDPDTALASLGNEPRWDGFHNKQRGKGLPWNNTKGKRIPTPMCSVIMIFIKICANTGSSHREKQSG